MTNREAKQVISAFLFRTGLEGIAISDAELKALVMAEEALEDKHLATLEDSRGKNGLMSMPCDLCEEDKPC